MSGELVRQLRWGLALARWVANVAGAGVVFVTPGCVYSVRRSSNLTRRLTRRPRRRSCGRDSRTSSHELDAGIGVSAGSAVAGNVGSEHRFEYTIAGEPVSEAARLCELAKREPSRVLASATIVTEASQSEMVHWFVGGETVHRGRQAATRLATPTGNGAREEVSRC